MNYKSQLGYIMDLIEITGKDLATAINVNRTLVSKWKNGARVFKPSSDHFKNMIEVIIFFNMRRKDSTLERFFGSVYPNEDKNEPEYLEVCLTLWLIGKNLGNFNNLNDWRTSKSALYSANVEVYQGDSGKRNAVLDFFDYAASLPPGQEIFISDYEDNLWKTEDQEYYKLYHLKYYELVTMGHNITIVHNLGVHDTNPNNMEIERFQAYFTGNVTSYYLKLPGASLTEPSLYIIHRHMSLISSCSDGDTSNRHIAIYRDPFTIQHYVRLFLERVKISTKMVSTLSSKGGNLKSFMDDVIANMDCSNVYYTAPQLPLVAYTKDILQAVLEFNKVPPQLIDFIEWVRIQNQGLFLKNVETHDVELLLSKESITEAFNSDEVILKELSSLCQMTIKVNHNLLREIYCSSVQLSKKHKSLNISVVPFNDLPILNDIVMWMFEDHMMVAIKLKASEHFVVSHAPVILTNTLDYVQNLLMVYEDEPNLEYYIKK